MDWRGWWSWLARRFGGALDLIAAMAHPPMWLECPAAGCRYAVIAQPAGYRRWSVMAIRPVRGRPRVVAGWPRCPAHDLMLIPR